NGFVSWTQSKEYDVKSDQENSGTTIHVKHGEDFKKEIDANTYTHPAFIVKNPIVWIPQDLTGLYLEEFSGCQEFGLNVTYKGAIINEKFKVEVDLETAPNIKDELYVESSESSEIMIKDSAN
ncbi:11178_t:CDS:2, partial [Scutellospora calospora]